MSKGERAEEHERESLPWWLMLRWSSDVAALSSRLVRLLPDSLCLGRGEEGKKGSGRDV